MPDDRIHQTAMHLINEATTVGIYEFGVNAVIRNGNKVLVVRRKKEDVLGGKYEIPGGGLEKGERLEDGLKREVVEETGLRVKRIIAYLSQFDINFGGRRRARNFVFMVEVVPGKIRLTEHDDYAWIDHKQLDYFSMSKEMLKVLKKVFART